MIILTLLKSIWKPLVIILLVAFLLLGFSHFRYTAGQTAANLAWSVKWKGRDAADAKARAAAETEQRNKERQRQAAAMEEGKRADEELAKAKAAAANAKRAGDGLQQQLDRLQQRFNAERATSSISTTAAVSQAKSEAIMVLTDVLSESVARNRKLAAALDQSYIAGSTCERTYSKVTGGK